MSDATGLGWLREMLAEKELGRAELGTMKVDVSTVRDPAEVLERMREFKGAGWICYTDQVVETRNGDNIVQGTVLSAELVEDQRGASLHVRNLGTEWLVSKIYEEQGAEHLIVEEKRLRIGGGSLNYRVAWGQAEDGEAWQPTVFRFTGFGG